MEELTCNSCVVKLPFGDTFASLSGFAVIEYKTVGTTLCLCFYLNSETRYELTSFPSETVFEFTTLVGPENAIFYVGHAHTFLCTDCPYGDYLWTDSYDVKLWERLFVCGLFCLPHGDIVLIPNPRNRFCFDLDQPIVWRKLRGKCDFGLRVHSVAISGLDSFKNFFQMVLRTCANAHKDTWITDEFVRVVTAMVGGIIDFHVFELLVDGAAVAYSVGYQCGGTGFMDFTACTLVRSKSSFGKRLILAQCEWLQNHGVRLWYLGFELEYMRNLCVQGAKVLSRAQFQLRW